MTRQSRRTGRALGASALLCLSLALGAAIGPAAANKVGVAAAVNPDAFSSLSGAPKSQLNIGKSIFYNERIATTTSGLVQVLLVDGSTFTVGPDSDLVIDKFVYDPNKGTGQIAASFSKGVMRFVGGKISKSDNAVTINTPAGAMAVRGCIILTQVTPSSFAAVLVYGDYLKMKNFVVYEPGNGLFISTTGNAEVRKATAADIGGMTAALSRSDNQNNSGNDSSKLTTGTALQMVDTASLNELIQNANTQTVVADSTKVEVPAVPTIPEPEVQQVTARVLTPPGVYSLEDGTNIPNPSDHGILGGGTYPEGATPPLADDFEWTFNVSEGRFTGTVEGLTDVSCAPGSETCVPEINDPPPPPATVNFPWFEPNQNTGPCVNGVCEVTDATLTQEGETETLTGTAVSKPGFFSYQLINTPETGSEDDPEPMLLFGGEAYSLPTQGTGQLRKFDLTADAASSGAAGPFMSTDSSPVLSEDSPAATVTPLMMLDKDPDPVEGENPSRRVWLQSSFSMEGSGPAQQSSVNVALGEWDPETGLTGARRGGSHVDITSSPCELECGPTTTRESNAFTGDIASLEGPDGAHFMGTDNPNIVVGIDSTGSLGRDAPLDPNSTPIQEQVGATYHVGVGGDPTTPTQSLQGVKQGYAAGIVESKVYPGSEPGSEVQFANVVASKSSDDMGVNFDPAANTLAADITVYDVQNRDGATSQYQLHFGDSEGSSGRSAYIDDGNYAAIERATFTDPETGVHTPAQVFDGAGYAYEQSDATSYFVNGDQLGVTKYFPETFGEADASGNPPPFCTDCEFIEWGAWGSRVEFGNDPQNPYIDDVHLGWWVAGDITTDQQLAALADADEFMGLGPTAYYSGNAIGDVAYNPDGTGWTTYTATGKMEMDWNFNHRQGELRIKNFDTSITPGGLNFSGPMCAPGEGCGTRPGNHFGGPLNTVQPVGNGGQLPSNLANISGSATGSFVNDGPDKPAAGAIGNWNVSNSMHGAGGYKATGIFAGRRGPGPN